LDVAIPDFQTLMLPVLRRLAAGRIKTGALIDVMADEFGLTDVERSTMLPSGRQTAFSNRVHWALAYLTRAKLSDRPARATYEASERGRAVLAEGVQRIDTGYLRRFPEFRTLRPNDVYASDPQSNGALPPFDPAAGSGTALAVATPDEQIEAAIAATERALRDELLQRVLASTPRHFEDLVLDLMGKMGYGDTAAGARERLGGFGDGGVDGIIREDRLGLDVIYLQAKRYTDTAIAAEQLRAFAGALADKGARKGVFLTTSRFTREAEEYAKRQQQTRIVLIDGDRLTDLMLRYEVGVRAERTIVLKKIDTDYFDPDDTL